MDGTFQYIAFYKPYGVLTDNNDTKGRAALKDYIDLPGMFPVGRLDLDSEGLLLLTNNGLLSHRLTDPRYHHPKTYLVQVEGVVPVETIAVLAQGVRIKSGYQTQPCQVEAVPEPDLPPRSKPVSPNGPTSWLKMILREGKKRQIRHMTATVGFPTLRLVRVAMGPVELGSLQPGEWRFLGEEEACALEKLADPGAQRRVQR